MADKTTFAPVATFTNDTTAVTQTNANYVLMQNAIDNTLSRDGTTPNQMGANLDMNTHRILNLSSPGSPNEPLRLADITLVPPAGAVFASPTAVVGTTAVNGVATTIMRSDAAPPIDQTMAPTWTGKHIFNGEVDLNSTVKVGAATETFPASGIIVGTTDTQTLTNKTLTSPVIGTIVNTGTLTLPTSTDTIVGRATTDTLTNKTLTTPAITGPVTITGNATVTGTSTLTGTVSAGADVQATGYLKSGGFNRLTSNFSSVTTSLANTGISISLTSGVNYTFEGTFFFPSSGAQNLTLAFGGTATASSFIAGQPLWVKDAGAIIPTGTTGNFVVANSTIINNNAGGAQDSWVLVKGFIACNSTGTFTIRMAQNTLNAGVPQVMSAGSYLQAYQVA